MNYKVTFLVNSTSQVIHVSAENPDMALKLAAEVRWPSGCRIQDYSHEGWYQAEVYYGSEDLRYEDFQVLIEEGVA